MRINGVWVGWGLGDNSTSDMTVRRAKSFMRAMYKSYAGNLADTNHFDQEMYDVVCIMQDRLVQSVGRNRLYVGQFIRGVLDLPTQIAMGFKKVNPILPIIFTVEGHMSNMFFGPAAANAETLQNQGVCHWKPIGYVNNDIPFHNGPGIAELVNQVRRSEIEGPPGVMWPFPNGTPWGIIGFSRGSMITSDFMAQHVMTGDLNWRLPSFKRGLALGNPRREFGKCAPWADNPPPVNTGGIMDRLFTTTGTVIADRWAENANAGDMFAQNTRDSTGLMKTTIARIITEGSFFGGQASVFARVLAFFGNPSGELFSDIKAAFDAIMFLARNPNPHYSTIAEPGDIEWMRGVAA